MAEPTLAELREQALAALATPAEKQEEPVQQAEEKTEEKTDPPRDEKGRFVKQDAADEEGGEEVFEVRIDLGDGSGVQVFEGKSERELVEKLAKAQEHATRKIRELSAAAPKEVKEAAKKIDEDDDLSEDQKFLLTQQLLTDPQKVIDHYVERAIRKQVAPKLKEVDEITREKRDTATAQAWVESTPGYHATPKNGAKLQKYLETHGMEMSAENLNKAFEDLNESGLLELKPAEKQDAEDDTKKPEARIVTKVETGVIRRKVVGALPAKRQAQAEVKATEPTEEDLRKMPIEQLRQLTYASLRQQ